MADVINGTMTIDGQILVTLANDMLGKLHGQHCVENWRDIGASVFITLFEGLWGEPLPDVIRQPRSKEDEIHNCQAVIDTLSLDVLHTSLSHITGESVVDGDQDAILHLLEIFSGLLDYILNRISSDVSSTDNDDDLGGHDDEMDDPDLVTAEVIDNVLERELSHGLRYEELQHPRNLSKRHTHRQPHESSHMGDSTAELIALGHASGNLSHASHNTSELIALGDSHLNQHSPPRRGPRADFVPLGRPNNERVKDTSVNSTIEFARELQGDSILAGGGEHIGQPGSLAPRYPAPTSDQEPVASEGPLTDTLESSVSSSVSMPKPVVLSDGGSRESSQSEFNYLGVRPRPQGSMVASDIPSGGRKGQSHPHQTITHHVYHHYNGNTDLKQTVNGTLSSTLPLSSSFGKQTSKSQTHEVRQIPTAGRRGLASSLPLPAKKSADPGRLATSGNTEQRGSSPGRARSYENLDTLVKDTVAMTRAAVKSQPKDRESGLLLISDLDQRLGDVLKNVDQEATNILRHVGWNVSGASRTSLPLTQSQKQDTGPNTQVTQDEDRSKRKVSFLSGEPTGSWGRTEKKDKKKSHRSGCIDLPHQTFPPKHRNSQKGSSSLGADNKQKKLFKQPSNKPLKAKVMKRSHPKPMADELLPPQQTDSQPRTFDEYLDKYYGAIESRDRRYYSTDSSVLSDTEVDYREESIDDSIDREVQLADLDSYRERVRRGKSVRFEDILDDSAPGEMGGIRRKLRDEEVRAQSKSEILDKIYKHELDDFEEELCNSMKTMRASAKEKEDEYRKKVLSGPKMSKYKPGKKLLACHTSLLKARARSKTRSNRGRKRSASASPSVGRRKSPVRIADNDILPWLLEEFPFLQLSRETLHELWHKSTRQIEQLSRAQQEVYRAKSKSQIEVEEAEKRQQILSEIMRKEMLHNDRMREVQARQKAQTSVKARIRDKRIQSARARRYYDEYQIRNRSKMLKKKTKEELIFKQLFREGLDIQKERIHELRKYAKDHRKQRVERQKNELLSLENYYRDQFSMLTDTMAREREDLEVREKAQAKVLEQMKRELRQKMEREIRDFQQQLYRDEDDEYFRQLDAERLKQQLHMARYQARV